jgi:soluble lytic murein transglycosylase-like protein
MLDSAPYKSYADEQANANGVPTDLFSNLIYAESKWNPNAVSSAGAEGIAQIMPTTAPGIDRFDPYQSIAFAAKYLRSLYNQFGDWTLAVAAYNAGAGTVARHNNTVPPYPETQKYVAEIMTPTVIANIQKKTLPIQA